MHPKALRPRRPCDRGVPYTAAWRADDYGRGSAAPGYGWPHPASEAVRALDCRSSWSRSERLESRARARSGRHASAPSGRVLTPATAGESERKPTATVERLFIVLSVFTYVQFRASRSWVFYAGE